MWPSDTKPYRAVLFQCDAVSVLTTQVQRFRKALFIDRLGWLLRAEGDREIDEFDTQLAVYLALFAGDTIVGSFRAIRTDGEYLAAKVFPQLATLRPYPRRRDAWEISRFGVLDSYPQRITAKLNYALMFQFALKRGARSLVAIGDPAYERYLARQGIRTRRYGPPHLISGGASPLTLVAGEIPLDLQSVNAFDHFLTLAEKVPFDDQTLVFGHTSISA